MFGGVLPGQCYVEVTPLDAYKFLTVESGGNQIKLFDGTSPVVDIKWNDIIDNWEVGVYLPVALGNQVWDDFNDNNLRTRASWACLS